MSAETPDVREKNPYQLRREAVARAIKAWQQEEDDGSGHEVDAASALEDCLLDEGLILMPRSTGHGKWRVLVDGEPAPYVGQNQPSHPMGAEEAAEVFLTQTAGDYYNQREVLIRPASSAEMVTSAVLADTAVREEPVRVAADTFLVEVEVNTGATLLRLFDKDGREVMVGLDDEARATLSSILRADGDDE
ncbi:hypothetical protein ACIBHX_01615 [Nonomuraea sp. NPDC050536]|uniref:hypothetical protein n=1 Tax=Nonomuraea sp. NPDC050536 TaxID=3364366 RepID=UPI0037CC0526